LDHWGCPTIKKKLREATTTYFQILDTFLISCYAVGYHKFSS